MSEKDIDLKKAESELRGTTLRVYWYLFKKGQGAGVREVQRRLGMSSPSTALHHLDKLRGLGLVEKDSFGQYAMLKDVKVGALRFFMRLGTLVLPRYLFYAVFFSTSLVVYLYREGFAASVHNVMAIMFGLSAAAVCWYETARIWSERFF